MRLALKCISHPGLGAAILCSLLVIAGAGCPVNTGHTRIGHPQVDLAVGDLGINFFTKSSDAAKQSDLDFAKILLYFHVLQGDSQQNPDVVLTGATNSNILFPVSIQLTGDATGNDLYVADNGSDTVQIWRDYRDLVPTKSAKGIDNIPNVVLDCTTSGINTPQQILDVGNRLYVSNLDEHPCALKSIGGSVEIFDHAGAIETGAGDTPSLELTVPGAFGIDVANDTLYVAAAPALTKSAKGVIAISDEEGAVYVFNDITGRLDAAKGVSFLEPSAILTGPSFLNLPVVLPSYVKVFGNRLYVSTYVGILFVFNNADALVDLQEPAAVINATTGVVGNIAQMRMIGDTLYVGDVGDISNPGKAGGEKDTNVGLTAFRPGHGIVTGQNAVMSFDATNSQIMHVTEMASEDNTLFVGTYANCCSSTTETGDIHIFEDADTLLVPNPGDIVLPALKDFVFPSTIDTNTFVTP